MVPQRRRESYPVAALVRFVPAVALMVGLVFAPQVQGKGTVGMGGELAVGLSTSLLSETPSRPLTPLNSFLLDHIYETVFPIENGTPLATLEETEPGKIRLMLGANIVCGDAPMRLLSAQDVIKCWQARARDRWDARWALRGIGGIDDVSGGISGLQAFDERTLECSLRESADINQIRKALRSPALRLALLDIAPPRNGTGPFVLEPTSQDRKLLTCALAHHAGRPYLDEVTVIPYQSAEDSVLDFGRGRLDALLVASNERNRYAESSRAATDRLETIGEAVLVVLFNPARLPTTRERRSLALAADREGIARIVLGGDAVATKNFLGSPAEALDWAALLDEARTLYSQVQEPRRSLTLLVCDDPAARAAAGRLRANWESLGVPVELSPGAGPLALSYRADAILLALRLPRDGDGVLPQCLALYDRSGWWEIAGLALDEQSAGLLRRVRALDLNANLEELGASMEAAGLAIPLARYGILFAPGPDVSLVPDEVYPGPVLWRAFMGTLPEPSGEAAGLQQVD